MKTNDKLIDILNDLIRINNDRVEGYEKAVDEINDVFSAEIKTLLFQMAEESRAYERDLADTVLKLGGTPAKDTTASGKIYRVWMDLKTTFSGNNILSVLESCEAGEDAALKAYKDALEEDVEWPEEIYRMVSSQRLLIKVSHDRIKLYRDEYKAAHSL